MHKEFSFKGRYVVLISVLPFLPWVYLPAVDFLYLEFAPSYEEHWFKIIYGYCVQGLLAFMLLVLGCLYKTPWGSMLNVPDQNAYWPALELTAFSYVFSILSVYLLFLPLSYLVPEFVQSWYLDSPSIISGDQNSFPVLPNVLTLVLAVVLAPMLEELAFRGVLLHRWIPKWGKIKAVLLSSLIFGLLHPTDPLGAAVFGIVMSAIYLRTQSLLLPILCHALHNLVVWLYSFWYFKQTLTSTEPYTIEQFQSEDIYAITSLVIVGIWIYTYKRRHSAQIPWKLPRL